MITASRTPAEAGDIIGFYATAGIAFVCIVIGFVALIQWRDKHDVGDSFSDDYIPDRDQVAATEHEHLPKMPRQP